MKELILTFALQFSADFNKPLDSITYRLADLDNIAIISRVSDGYEIAIDERFAKVASSEQLKTVVYHMTGKVHKLEGYRFMDEENILKPYRKLK